MCGQERCRCVAIYVLVCEENNLNLVQKAVGKCPAKRGITVHLTMHYVCRDCNAKTLLIVKKDRC